MKNDLVSVWQTIILGDNKSWVLFENGTCVILTTPEVDLIRQAKGILAKWGIFGTASALGDFSPVKLSAHPGWVVTFHHPDILTYVDPEEIESEKLKTSEIPMELLVGLIGREKRASDAEEMNVIHVES